MTPPRTAALDIGSNSVHLLVAGRGADAVPVPVLDTSEQSGIGAAVDATGRLGLEIRAVVLGVVVRSAEQARELGADRVLVLGTEALRRAADTPDLAHDLEARARSPLTMLDATTEGLLTLLGVTQGRIGDPVAVIDIGGGSSEVSIARADAPTVVRSLAIGSARLAAAHATSDPVTGAQVHALRQAARDAVVGLELPAVARAIVSGGSGTNVSRLLGRARTTPVDRSAIAEAFRLLGSEPAAVLAARTGLTPRRVAQLAAGVALDEAFLDHLGLDVLEVSDASLREGALIATWLLGDRWLDDLPTLVGGR